MLEGPGGLVLWRGGGRGKDVSEKDSKKKKKKVTGWHLTFRHLGLGQIAHRCLGDELAVVDLTGDEVEEFGHVLKVARRGDIRVEAGVGWGGQDGRDAKRSCDDPEEVHICWLCLY